MGHVLIAFGPKDGDEKIKFQHMTSSCIPDVFQRRLLSDSEQIDTEKKDVKKKDGTVFTLQLSSFCVCCLCSKIFKQQYFLIVVIFLFLAGCLGT